MEVADQSLCSNRVSGHLCSCSFCGSRKGTAGRWWFTEPPINKLDLLASGSASLQPPASSLQPPATRQTVQLDMTHRLSSVRASDTKPEWILRGGLHRLGFRYRLHRKDLPGKPDLVFPKYRSVVFVHGCFWHRHIKCKDASMPSVNQEFWMNKFIATIRRDSRVLRELHDLEWKTMIVWECQLEKIR
jgi:DNA mismatch endonuclease (patch repair protein)